MDPIADTLLLIIVIALSILTAFSIVAFYYFLRIMDDIRAITKHLRETTAEITDDIENIREKVKTGDEKIRSAVSFFNYFLPKKKQRKAAKKS